MSNIGHSYSISAGICRLVTLPDAGEVSAEHELHLVKYHEGEQEIVVELSEDGEHHGGAHGQAFLGAAEDNGDAVFTFETKESAAVPGGKECHAEDNDADYDKPGKLRGLEFVPVAAAGRIGESRVYHQPDGAAIVPSDESLMSQHPFPEQRLAELTENERKKNLVADFQHGVETDLGSVAIGGKE